MTDIIDDSDFESRQESAIRNELEPGMSDSGAQQLYTDAFVEWMSIAQAIETYDSGDFSWQQLSPYITVLRKYEERLACDIKYSDANKHRIMQLSDKQAIIAFDQLVDEWNANVGDIIARVDIEKMKTFIARAKQLLRARKEGPPAIFSSPPPHFSIP